MGMIDRKITFEEYLASAEVRKLRDQHYQGHVRLTLD
jgi:hypothetical protein